MPKISEMSNSNYLKAQDFTTQGRTLTMRTVQEETLGRGKNADDKWVLYFEEEEKGLVLNKVNMTTIAELYGDDTDDWEGHQVTLFQTKVEFEGKRVPAIRILDEKPRKKGKPEASGKVKSSPKPARGGKGKDEDEDQEDEDDAPF